MNQAWRILARGRTADVFELDETRVLKLFHDWCPQRWIDHESHIADLISKMNIPVPEKLGEMDAMGRRGIVYRRIYGHSMYGLLTKRPWRMVQYAELLAGLHSRLHDMDGSSLYSLKESLAETIQRVDMVDTGLKQRILEILETLPERTALCHYDFHPGQVLLTDEGPVIIDWMTARYGDPLADVARSMVIFTFGANPGVGAVTRVMEKISRRMFRRAYMKAYLELRPEHDLEQLLRWMVPVSAGRLDEDIMGERKPILRFIESQVRNSD